MSVNSENTRRRTVLRAGLSLVAAGTAVAAARPAAAQDKLAQALVQYQATPKNGQRCDACVNWVVPNACTIVVSPIAAAGWCVAYAPKNG